MTDAQTPREVITAACAMLAKQANRCMRAGQSLTKTALRLAGTDRPTEVLQALAKYRHAALPEPELVAEVSAMIEGTLSPEKGATMAKQRERRAREQMGRTLGRDEPCQSDYPPEMVLRIARERSDALGAAVDAIERRADPNGRSATC